MINGKHENVFNGAYEVRYLLEGWEDSSYLVVVFSGYCTKENIKAEYNYVKTLSEVLCNKLFILDNYGYEERGTWYLGENMNFDFEKSVIALIKYVQDLYNISNNKVMLCGSSKGGFAAIYYGEKYNFGHIIAGAPQIFLVSYLKKVNEKILDNIIGDSKEENLENIETLIENLDKKCENIYLFCGINDFHLKNHVIPFIEMLDLDKVNLFFEILHGDHRSFVPEFTKRLKDTIMGILDNAEFNLTSKLAYNEMVNMVELTDIFVNEKYISINHDKNTVEVSYTILNINFMYACYLVKDDIPICKKYYQRDTLFEYELNDIGNYKIWYFIKDSYGEVKSITSQICSINP